MVAGMSASVAVAASTASGAPYHPYKAIIHRVVGVLFQLKPCKPRGCDS